MMVRIFVLVALLTALSFGMFLVAAAAMDTWGRVGGFQIWRSTGTGAVDAHEEHAHAVKLPRIRRDSDATDES